MINLCVQGSYGMNEVAIVVVKGSVFYAKSTQVLELDMNRTNSK